MPEIIASTFVLAVNDLEASRRFYVDTLGFEESLRVDGWSFLQRGACRLRIGDCPDAQPISQCQDHSWFAYLHVSDAAALYQELLSKQVQLWHALDDKPWGMREFGVKSADGHRIMIGQEIKTSAAQEG